MLVLGLFYTSITFFFWWGWMMQTQRETTIERHNNLQTVFWVLVNKQGVLEERELNLSTNKFFFFFSGFPDIPGVRLVSSYLISSNVHILVCFGISPIVTMKTIKHEKSWKHSKSCWMCRIWEINGWESNPYELMRTANIW